jgi:hypothetical protein
MMTIVNTDCMVGTQCPSSAPFRIAATALFTISDDGAEEWGDIEYGETFLKARCRVDLGRTLQRFLLRAPSRRKLCQTFAEAPGDRFPQPSFKGGPHKLANQLYK